MLLINEKGSWAGVSMIANRFERENDSYISDYHNTSSLSKC